MVDHIVDKIPFITHSGIKQVDYKLSFSRILEAVIIAVITGGLSIYAAQRVIETRLDIMSRQISNVEKTVDKIRNDMYAPRFFKQSKRVSS